jgi:hypothetical protein
MILSITIILTVVIPRTVAPSVVVSRTMSSSAAI